MLHIKKRKTNHTYQTLFVCFIKPLLVTKLSSLTLHLHGFPLLYIFLSYFFKLTLCEKVLLINIAPNRTSLQWADSNLNKCDICEKGFPYIILLHKYHTYNSFSLTKHWFHHQIGTLKLFSHFYGLLPLRSVLLCNFKTIKKNIFHKRHTSRIVWTTIHMNAYYLYKCEQRL